MSSNTVKRVVSHPKGWSYVDSEGRRVNAAQGDTVEVSAVAAQRFSDRLVDPAVAEARAKAQAAEAKALEEAAAAEEALKKPKVAPQEATSKGMKAK